MTDRSGRGTGDLDTVVEELDRLRRSLMHQRRTQESVDETRRMSEDLAAIQAGLKRLANELEQLPEFEAR